MFRELYDVARHTPLSIAITVQGEKLRVLVIPKPTEGHSAALSAPISALGTPAELDADLPAALLEYARKVNDLRTHIGLPLAELDEARSKAQKKPTKRAQPRPAPRKATSAKPAPVKKKAVAPKVITPPAPITIATTPAATTTATVKAKPSKHPVLPVSEPKIEGASKEQCLDDGRNYLRRIGNAKPSRVLFIRFARSGRRYEKIWTSFADFIDAVRALMPGSPIGDSGSSIQEPESSIAKTKAPVSETTAVKLDPSSQWPFPTSHHADDIQTKEGVRDIVTTTGQLIGSTLRALPVGSTYSHFSFGEFRVMQITDERIIVARPADEPTATTSDTRTGDLIAQIGD